jgi:hypothetical protein
MASILPVDINVLSAVVSNRIIQGKGLSEIRMFKPTDAWDMEWLEFFVHIENLSDCSLSSSSACCLQTYASRST